MAIQCVKKSASQRTKVCRYLNKKISKRYSDTWTYIYIYLHSYALQKCTLKINIFSQKYWYLKLRFWAQISIFHVYVKRALKTGDRYPKRLTFKHRKILIFFNPRSFGKFPSTVDIDHDWVDSGLLKRQQLKAIHEVLYLLIAWISCCKSWWRLAAGVVDDVDHCDPHMDCRSPGRLFGTELWQHIGHGPARLDEVF